MLRALLLVLLLFYSVALAYKARLDYIESKLQEEEHNKQMEVYITAKNKLKESTILLSKTNEQAWKMHKDLEWNFMEDYYGYEWWNVILY